MRTDSSWFCYLIIKREQDGWMCLLLCCHFCIPHGFGLPPFGSTVLEPNLQHKQDKSNENAWLYILYKWVWVCVCVANRDCFVITALPGFVISYTRFIGLKIHSFLSHRDTDTALESRHLGPEARIWSKVERLVPEFWTEIWLFPRKSTGFDSDQRSPFRMKYMPTVLAFQGQFKRKLTLTYT